MAESPRIIELQEKFEDNPRRYFASLANEYRKAGDLQRAISICRIYLEKQPGHTAGHVVLGQALYGTGKFDEAAESFRTVLALDPENLIALRCLGDIAQADGDLEAAHVNFRQVLTADPRDHDTSGRLKAVEQAIKAASGAASEEWMPPRSDEFAIPDEPPPSFATQSPEAEVPPSHNEIEVEVEVDVERDLEVEADSIEDIYEPGDFPKAAPDDSPLLSLEVENLPALEPPAVHEDIPEDDFLDTLLPSTETEADHHPAIAEPVALESAEESLAVPDLMEEADIPPAPPSLEAVDEYQYRTAEFSLPNYGSTEPETGATSTEMEDEAGALLDEGEAPAPAQARTGEYSLSRDIGEWRPETSEVPSHSAPDEDDHPDERAEVEPAGPFITETVAELYLQQGFTGEALLVYRQIARAKPADSRIAARVADLEQRLSEEHDLRQAALEAPGEMLPVEAEPELQPVLPSEPEPTRRQVHTMDSVVFDMTPPEPVRIARTPPPAPKPVAAEEFDDWFASGPVPHTRARQTVQEFFAVLGRATAEVKRKPERMRVSADDIRAAADVTAGFGAFGVEPSVSAPRPIAAPAGGESDPQEDVRRFRSWLDGLSDS